jgi:hypothetical protein
MKSLKKLFIFVLIPLTLVLYLPRITFCQQVHMYAKAEVTEHAPKIRTAPEKDIPTPREKRTPGWTWLLLIALAGGVAAIAGGGGGGGGDGGEPTPTPTTGSITGSW